jgi:FAD/FMN-containing dehydrogenase/Fe-S oxidoreductase
VTSTAAADLAAAFAARGRPLRTDKIARALYSTDASPYRIEPTAVLVAKHVDDIALAVELCAEFGVPLTARGAGTSLSGQCVGEGLQLDLHNLDAIEWIDAERRVARVQPGVSWWRLNAAARVHGLEFGPDPATKRVCTIGGMIGSNSGGTHSVVYGATVDHVHALDAVLADGDAVRLGESADGTVASAGAPRALADVLEQVRARTILSPNFSTLARRGSGYQLEHLVTARPHLGKLLAGSDGTLGLVTAAEVTLDPLPAVRALAVVGFDDMHAALAVVPSLATTGASAIELVSGSILDVARADVVHRAAVSDVDPDLGSLLFVEYSGPSLAACESGFARMERATAGARWSGRYTDPVAIARMWAIREAGVGALSSVAGGPLLPQAFVEDTTVAVERLPDYIREFERVFDANGFRAVWYGHASTGLIHVRPFVDMTNAGDLARLESLMRDAVDLVRAYGGDLCGEHGNGLSRTYWNERLFGPEIYGELRAIKTAFDARALLNPGKVVEGPHPLASLRYGADYARFRVPARLEFADQGGFEAAVERCFGAGACRKRDVGTMCPPAAATGLEEHSTRARANLLRAVVSGELPVESLRTDEAREVMDTCIGCKACKTECPARVDMARLKTEWSDHVRRNTRATPMQRNVARYRELARYASAMPRVANALLRSRALKRYLGVAPERALPPVARRPLTSSLRPNARADVHLFADCFTTYQEPHVGEAAATLVRAVGKSIGLLDAGCCARTMLSEGYVDGARATAKRTASALRRSDGPIMFAEPSCMSAVTDDWRHLIGDVSDIVERCVLAEEHVATLGRGGALRFAPGGRALLHGHCHQKALWGTGGTEAALALVDDLRVDVLDAGCCGMAGAFGYRADRQDLSRAMAERALLPAVRACADDEAVVAPGTSCRRQIADLGARDAVHPLAFLASRLA